MTISGGQASGAVLPRRADVSWRRPPLTESADLTVVLADSHPVVRGGMRALLASVDGIEVVAEAGPRRGAGRGYMRHPAGVVIPGLAKGAERGAATSPD